MVGSGSNELKTQPNSRTDSVALSFGFVDMMSRILCSTSLSGSRARAHSSRSYPSGFGGIFPCGDHLNKSQARNCKSVAQRLSVYLARKVGVTHILAKL